MDRENPLWVWENLIRVQIEIADRWLNRGRSANDEFAKFFFLFSGFNALYFLWSVIENLRNERGERPNEGRQIESLLRKFKEEEASEIIDKLSQGARYFCERNPIQRMDKRSKGNLNEGDPEEGKKWQRQLREDSSSLDRLGALGEILYLVRSNLVHGSKSVSGDDKEIITASILPLEVFLEKGITMTKSKCPWES